jgi:hypothetical protein
MQGSLRDLSKGGRNLPMGQIEPVCTMSNSCFLIFFFNFFFNFFLWTAALKMCCSLTSLDLSFANDEFLFYPVTALSFITYTCDSSMPWLWFLLLSIDFWIQHWNFTLQSHSNLNIYSGGNSIDTVTIIGLTGLTFDVDEICREHQLMSSLPLWKGNSLVTRMSMYCLILPLLLCRW